MAPEASVVIVSYESNNTLEFCLASLEFALKDIESQIIVWDNNSQFLDKNYFASKFPNVDWVFHNENIGFGKACNAAAKLATKSNLVFLNPDTICDHNSLLPLLNDLQNNSSIGIIGGKVLNSDGTLQMACRRSFPTPSNSLYRLLGLSRLFPQSKKFAQYDLRYLPDDVMVSVDAVSGSFFAIRQSVFKLVSGFDERFFMYGEDLDLCRRVQLAGFENIFQPKAPIVHLKGKSSESRPFKTFYNFYEAMIIFAKIHYGKVFFAHILLSLGVIISAVFAVSLRTFSKWKRIPFDLGLLFGTTFIFSFLYPSDFQPRYQEYILLGSIAVFVNFILGKYRESQIWKFWELLVYSIPGIFIVVRYLDSDFSNKLAVIYSLLFPVFYFLRQMALWTSREGFQFLKRRRKILFVGENLTNHQIDLIENYKGHFDFLGFIKSPERQADEFNSHCLGEWDDLDYLKKALGPFELWVLPEKKAWWREKRLIFNKNDQKMPIFLVYESSQTSAFNVVNLHLI
tara:strand:+ start:323 stop:1861 length:1539 start_codon:yes stop_codon:yes gene_type:complete